MALPPVRSRNWSVQSKERGREGLGNRMPSWRQKTAGAGSARPRTQPGPVPAPRRRTTRARRHWTSRRRAHTERSRPRHRDDGAHDSAVSRSPRWADHRDTTADTSHRTGSPACTLPEPQDAAPRRAARAEPAFAESCSVSRSPVNRWEWRDYATSTRRSGHATYGEGTSLDPSQPNKCWQILPAKQRQLRIKDKWTIGVQRRISRWEHEALLEALEERLDHEPERMKARRQTVEHPFETQ